MRWPACCLGLLSLSLTVGCPTAHRRDGTLDRAMRKDLKERLETERCNREEYREFCVGQEDSAECLKECL